jgi:hypothetical protein
LQLEPTLRTPQGPDDTVAKADALLLNAKAEADAIVAGARAEADERLQRAA